MQTGRMSEPHTHLDQRFSEAGASALGWDEVRAMIERAELFWITTVRSDHRPHVTPLVAVWHEGALHFSTGTQEQKTLNLDANPDVALTTGTNEWNRGVDVIIEGRADRVTDHDRLTALAAAWRTKWDGRWTFHVAAGGFTHAEGDKDLVAVYAVQPTRAFAFGKAPASQTTYRFA